MKSFMDYKKQYNVTIKDPKQPMLISKAKKKTHEEADQKIIRVMKKFLSRVQSIDNMKISP